jgi:hypothetical protein
MAAKFEYVQAEEIRDVFAGLRALGFALTPAEAAEVEAGKDFVQLLVFAPENRKPGAAPPTGRIGAGTKAEGPDRK